MSSLFGKISKMLNISGRDAKLIVVSLLLAYGIWLIHNLTLNYTEVVRVPVTAQCDIVGHALKSSNSSVVMARCRTSGFRLIQLGKAESGVPVSVKFNVQDMHKKTDELYYVTSDDLNRYFSQIFGNGTKLEAFISDTIMFRFPIENHKRVPVQAVYSIAFKPQYTNIGDLKLTPDSVTVYGEPFHIGSIDRVFTEPVTLTDISSSVHGEARIDKMKGVRISDESIRYSMDVSRFVELKSVLPVYTKNVPKGKSMVVFPSMVHVKFRCAFPVTVNPLENAKVYVEYEDFTKSLDGQCIPHVGGLSSDVFSYEIEPEVLDCIESGK